MKKIIAGIMLLLGCGFLTSAQTPFFVGKTESVGDTIDIIMRAIEPATYEVDFGDGLKVPVMVDSAITHIYGGIGVAKEVKVYGKAENLWVFSSYHAGYTEVNVDALVNVTCLGLAENKLTSLNLSKLSKVEELSLSRNPLESLDISMFPKLRTLSVYETKLKSIDLTKNPKLRVAYLSMNDLGDLDLSNNSELYVLGCNGCGLKELNVSNCKKLNEITCTNNELTKLDISACTGLNYLDCRNNRLVIGEIPVFYPVIPTSFKYAPQKDIPMPDTCGYVDFSAGYEVDGYITEYVWRTAEGKTLIKGLDYEINGGITNFLKAGLKVSCQLTNDFFPKLTGADAMKTEFFITKISAVANEDALPFDTKAYTMGRKIHIEAEESARVEIFNATGTLVHAAEMATNMEYEAKTSGLYIVKINGRGTVVHKVMVR